MRKTILIAAFLLVMTSLFAVTPPKDAPAYMEYPETGFIAWSYTEKELPLSISTADMCIALAAVFFAAVVAAPGEREIDAKLRTERSDLSLRHVAER